MNFKQTVPFWLGMLVLPVQGAAFGQAAGTPRSFPAAAPGAPTITISAASTGALIRGLGAGNASLDLGAVSYYRGTSARGASRRKNSKSFVISTRFVLKVDCPGSSPSSQVNVTASRPDAAVWYAIAIDGTTLGLAAQPLAGSMACGSAGEHRLEVEVPVSTPAGSIESSVTFVATLK